MARVLAYTSPPAGHVYPIVPTLLELAARGHRVIVRTAAARVPELRAAGLDAAPVDPAIEAVPVEDWRGRDPLDAVGRLIRVFEARAPFEVTDVGALVASARPDLLVVDVNCLGAMIAAEASGLPWVVSCPHPAALRAPGEPPFGPGRAAARWPAAKVRRAADSAWNSGLDGLNQLRADAGLAPARHLHELQYLRARRVLCFTAEPFEQMRPEWPATFRLVGPSLWEPPSQETVALEDGSRPLVLVTASTAYQADERLIAVALAALAGEPGPVIATTGAHDPASFEVPPNARVERFAAHGPLLRRCACVVTHGGMGITQKALAAGVPVCVVPFGRDQSEVALRVERSGAGVALDRRRLTPEALRIAVRAARACAPGARAVAAAFARAGGPSAAAEAAEELLPPAAVRRDVATQRW
ncbi:MAG: hypothetical protein QOJ29_1833 [Thermoleophilaceae bacterium]|jgi:MGT family glycosyltransferase|nr:hypothetical protein [Thermoleophilaceae bacterium]